MLPNDFHKCFLLHNFLVTESPQTFDIWNSNFEPFWGDAQVAGADLCCAAHTPDLCREWSADTAPATAAHWASQSQRRFRRLWGQPSSPALFLQPASLGFLLSCMVICPVAPGLPKLRRTEPSVWCEHGGPSDHHCQRRVSSPLGCLSGFSSLPLARKLLRAEVLSVAPSSFGSWLLVLGATVTHAINNNNTPEVPVRGYSFSSVHQKLIRWCVQPEANTKDMQTPSPSMLKNSHEYSWRWDYFALLGPLSFCHW